MEADVNVLVVGSSTARRGAIGRHFLFPLIRRCLKPVLRRWLMLPSGDWASEAGEGPTESWERGGEVGVCSGGGSGGSVNLPFFFINMADFSQQG